MITEQRIHAYIANTARREQLIAFEEELQWADRETPSPRAFKKERISFKEIVQNIINAVNLKQYLP